MESKPLTTPKSSFASQHIPEFPCDPSAAHMHKCAFLHRKQCFFPWGGAEKCYFIHITLFPFPNEYARCKRLLIRKIDDKFSVAEERGFDKITFDAVRISLLCVSVENEY